MLQMLRIILRYTTIVVWKLKATLALLFKHIKTGGGSVSYRLVIWNVIISFVMYRAEKGRKPWMIFLIVRIKRHFKWQTDWALFSWTGNHDHLGLGSWIILRRTPIAKTSTTHFLKETKNVFSLSLGFYISGSLCSVTPS